MGKSRKKGCDWAVVQKIEAPRAASCPKCGSGVNVTTTDACEYAYFAYGPNAANKWQILDV